MTSSSYVGYAQEMQSPLRYTVLPESVPIRMRRIGVILRNGFSLPDLATIDEVFQLANKLGSSPSHGPRYELFLLSAEGGRIVSASSVFVATTSVDTANATDSFDALFFTNGADSWGICKTGRLSDWLDRISAQRALLPASTGEIRRDDFPRTGSLSITPTPYQSTTAYVKDPAQAIAARNLKLLKTALIIVQEDLGADAAMEIAHTLTPANGVGLSGVEGLGTAPNVSNKIQSSAKWLQANGDRPVSIGEAADVAAMSERNFLRRFKREMGLAPSQFLLQVRLDMVCRLLVDSDLPVDKIARRCGIGGGERLAKIFRKHLNLSPTEYRKLRRLAGSN